MAEPIQVTPDMEVQDLIELLRLRGPGEIALRVLGGTGLAQSRFNFRLLSLHASENAQRVVVESDDDQVLRLAADAGLPVHATAAPLPAEEPVGPADPGEEYADYEEYPAAVAPVSADPLGPPSGVDDDVTNGGYGAYGTSADGDDPYDDDPGHEAGYDEDDDFGEADPAGAVAGPGYRQPLSRRRLFLYAAAFLVLLIGIAAVVVLVPSATVTITVPSTAYSTQVDLTAQPDGGALAVRTSSVWKQVSASFPATGQKSTPGTQATGSVQYTFNHLCNGVNLKDQISVPQGTTVTSKSGVVFVQQQAVTVSFLRSVSAGIKAQAAGAAGNVASGQITAIQNGGSTASCLSTTNPQATKGGVDPLQQTVIQSLDLTNAQAQLEQKAQQEIQMQLASQVRSGESMPTVNPVSWGSLDFSTDHAEGSVVANFNATLTLQGTGSYYQPAQVAAAFRTQLAAHVPAGQELTPDGFSAVYTSTGADGGRVAFKGQATGRVAPQLDLTQIQHRVATQTTASAQTYLQSLPGRVTLTQYPLPLPFTPLLSSRISVRYVVEQPAATPTPQPSTSPAAGAH